MSLILLVEDEPALLESYGEVVEEMGHQVCKASSGTQAIEVARAERPDLIVTDYMMPGRTGVDLIRALRIEPTLKHVPVVLISAARPREAEEAWRFLHKPITIDDLERAIRDGLEASVATSGGGRPTNASPLAIAREEMLSWISHEIRTPLSAAVMAADLLRRELSASHHTGERRVENVLRQLRRVDELVKSILDASALEDGRLQVSLDRFDLASLVREAVFFWQTASPEMPIRLEAPDNPIWVDADRDRTRQILDNLLSNGLKHGRSPRGLEVQVISTEEAQVMVRDHGDGISSEELPRVFDRFYRANGASRGHGLGLYIASALARVQGGNLRVESERGNGATFILALPANPA